MLLSLAFENAFIHVWEDVDTMLFGNNPDNFCFLVTFFIAELIFCVQVAFSLLSNAPKKVQFGRANEKP